MSSSQFVGTSTSAAPAFEDYTQCLRELTDGDRSKRAIYAPLIDFLNRRTSWKDDRVDGDAWLLRFYKSGKPCEYNRYKDVDPNAKDNNLESGGQFERLNRRFQDTLEKYDADVQCQVLLLGMSWSGPPAWTIHLFGLSLDMRPDIWTYLCTRTTGPYTTSGPWKSKNEVIWFREPEFIEVGENALLVLEASKKRPKTGMLIMGRKRVSRRC